MAVLPWCAALHCPAPQDCEGYITINQGNQTKLNFVACCKILCGRSANEKLLDLECGGATPATAVGTIVYLLVLLLIGAYIIAVGPFRRAKRLTFIVIACGSLIFSTATGVFVTNVTSPFRVLQSLPAVGAMNVAVFSYFFTGFQYAVGLAYEGAPLLVFVTTAVTIWKAMPSDLEGPIRDANRIALAMLLVAGIWILHSVSYRLYGYRVDWRMELKKREDEENSGERLNPNFHLGAAQGHPTWRTPVGQSSSVLMTGLAWALCALTRHDLANLGCRPGWVFNVMLYGAPCLITFTIVWNVLSATRRRTIHNVMIGTKSVKWFSGLRIFNWIPGASFKHEPASVEADYPGCTPYMEFWANRKNLRDFCVWNKGVREEYVRAVASQRMGRNSVFREEVHDGRLKWTDKKIGIVAWFLAQVGLVLSFPGFFMLNSFSELFGSLFELFGLKRLVETVVEAGDQSSLAEEIDQCYVGRDLPAVPPTFENILNLDITRAEVGRSVNLHTLLDSTGPAELYSLLAPQRSSTDQPLRP